jgi:hypothetical protein
MISWQFQADLFIEFIIGKISMLPYATDERLLFPLVWLLFPIKNIFQKVNFIIYIILNFYDLIRANYYVCTIKFVYIQNIIDTFSNTKYNGLLFI